jgi:hypothetical protein
MLAHIWARNLSIMFISFLFRSPPSSLPGQILKFNQFGHALFSPRLSDLLLRACWPLLMLLLTDDA